MRLWSPYIYTRGLAAPDNQPVAKVCAEATAYTLLRMLELPVPQFDRNQADPKHGLPSWVRDYSSNPNTPTHRSLAIKGTVFLRVGEPAGDLLGAK